MARKRLPYLRRRDRFRIRRKGKPPKEGWLLPELAALLGVKPRTIRYYVEIELIQPPPFYGTATRYQRPTLLRILAIQRMQREDHLPLAAIKTRLNHMLAADIEAYAIEKLTSGPVATALGVARPQPPAATTFGEAATPPKYTSVRWDIVHLMPGLSLFVYSDASPLVKKLAEQIYDHCVGAAGPPPAGVK